MDDRELPSDSEESDEDYVPSGEENKLSEEESDGEAEDGKEAGSDGEAASKEPAKSRKRQKSKKSKSSKRARVESPVEEVPTVEEEAETEEEKKKKADAIWAAFKTETSSTAKPSTVTSSEKNESEIKKPSEETKKKIEEVKTKPVTVTKIFEFAGEKVEVTEEVKPSVSKLPIGKGATAQKSRAQGMGILGKGGAGIPSRAGAGLAGFLGNLGKKNKLSVLEKSKLDWEGFKKKEGIDEEIQTHNRGKQGYLEKQDFLQRADMRQFELEKEMRTTVKRSNR